jgi:hypothetical protein
MEYITRWHSTATRSQPTELFLAHWFLRRHCRRSTDEYAVVFLVLLQLMPSQACVGVENWNSAHGSGCPGEDIWDHGSGLLKQAGKDATWGMAINPVNRRGQHQVRINLNLCCVYLAVCVASR